MAPTQRNNLTLEELQARVAALERLCEAQDQASREQAARLEQSLAELRDRASELARSEEALRQQTRILKAILDSMGDGVAVADEHGRLLLFNPAAERIYGLGLADIPPEQWSAHYGSFLPDGITPCPTEAMPLFRAIRGEEVDEAIEFVRNPYRPGGVWLSINARPLRDETGALRGGVSVYRDITAHRRAEQALRESEACFRELFENSPDAIFVYDLQGRVLDVNQAACRLHRLRHDELVGKDVLDLVPPDLRADVAREFALAARGHLDCAEGMSWTADGRSVPVEIRAARIEYRGRPALLLQARDISERKRVEARREAQLAVTQILAKATSLREAAPDILQTICQAANWELGALWCLERTVLRCVEVWTRPGRDLSAFERATRDHTFASGVGLPGRVWSSGEPAWIVDVTKDDNFPRAPFASQVDLRAAFGFPIRIGRQVIGVMEFYDRVFHKPDEDLLSTIASLAGQVGQFIVRRRAEEELRRSRERFELAVQGSGDGLFDWDVERDEVYFSPRWKTMLGYAEDEPFHTFEDWERLLHPEDRERALATVDAYLKGTAPTYELEHRLRAKDGSYRWILARGVALRDAEGKVYRMAGSHTDLTERKRMEQALRDEEALYHSLVDALPLNILRKDLEGRFTFANQLFCQTLGRPLEQILGRTDYDFYPRELAEKFRNDDQKVMASREIFEDIEENIRPSGEKFYVQVKKAPVYDANGRVVGTQTIFWDVTDRKRAEEEMRRARDAAEAANRAKSEFLANMSHEIRTPMNAIIGMTELVLDTPLTPEQRESLDLVRKSADALLGVINDILDFSKIEAGKLDLDEVDLSLREVLGDALNTLAWRAHQKGLELAFDAAPDVPDALRGDPVRLRQILMNLVGNALKFTERGEVVVEVKVEGGSWTTEPAASFVVPSQPSTTFLHFRVRDTGIGIPSNKLLLIFAPFAQADSSTTRRYGGTGLGLAITKRLVEMMGGQIWVESELGKGSTFHFTARFGIQQHPARTIPVDPEAVRGLTVLIVDDNATNRRILEQTLRHWGMRPTAVASAQEALAELALAAQQGEPYPLVLLDVHMPDMDGFGLAEQMQSHPELVGATIMMLSSGGQAGDVARCRALGVHRYLTKPIKQVDLYKAIMGALGKPLTEETAASPPEPRRPRSQTLRVLLAEDNLVNQKLAVGLLQKWGHQVTVANTGREAVALVTRSEGEGASPQHLSTHWEPSTLDVSGTARQRPPAFDVVLMDVQMPEMDGLEATTRIRVWEAETGSKPVPIIAMTAYAMKGDRERCLAAGMNGYIAKPIRAQELFETLEGLGSQAAEPALRCAEPMPASVVDWARALAHVGGDRQLLCELVELFRQECPRWLEDLRQAVASHQAARVRTAAHTLKGSLGSIAAQTAYEAALSLETMGRNGNLTGAAEVLSRLEREVEALEPALAAFVQETMSKSPV